MTTIGNSKVSLNASFWKLAIVISDSYKYIFTGQVYS
jgi:hypothetical protein